MGRKVFITSDMSIDERVQAVAEVNTLAALAWPWLLTAFDDWGRLEANPARLKLAVFPAIAEITRETIESALLLYDEIGLITLYEADGKRYAFIPPEKWFKYQTHIRASKRETDNSKHPAPPADALKRAGARRCAQPRDDTRICTPSPSPSPSPTPTGNTTHTSTAEAADLSDHPPPPLTPEQICELWNEICGDVMPKVQTTIPPGRRAKLKSRAAVKGRDRAWWSSYFLRIRASPHCCGESKPAPGASKPWRATLDWATRSEDVVTRVLEGQYGSRSARDSPSPEFRRERVYNPNVDGPGGEPR